MTDANGHLLFSMRDKLLAIMHTFVAEDERGNEIFRVKKKLACECALLPTQYGAEPLTTVGTKMTATFRNAVTGQDAELSVRGDMFGFGSTITLNGSTPVAQISRKLLHLSEWISDKQTVSDQSGSRVVPCRGRGMGLG